MPALTPIFTNVVYRNAGEIPSHVIQLMHRDARRANIILPTIIKSRTNTQGNSSKANLWVVSSSLCSNGDYQVDFVTAVTEGLIGSYPLFIYHARPADALTTSFLEVRMSKLAQALLDAGVTLQRVFSIFAAAPVTGSFVEAWTQLTGVHIHSDGGANSHNYYSAFLTYCDRQSLARIPKAESNSRYVTRIATMNDLEAVADLCFEFAATSEPFLLTHKEAKKEAHAYIEKGCLWLCQVTNPNGSKGVASICAITRTTSTVAGITKVFTNPQYRNQGCALRLVHAVCANYLNFQGKESVVLYVAHNNPGAQSVYHRVGFRGLDGQPCPGVESWLEVGFDQKAVRLGHW